MTLRTTIVTAGAFACMLLAGPANAADMARKAPMAVPVVQNWYGFYIGLHGGYAWGNDGVDFVGSTGGLVIGGNLPTSLSGNNGGFIGGVHWGSNYQFDRIVLGFDSDLSYIDRDESATVTLGGVTTTASQSLDWFGTTRVRAGYLVTPNALLYVTGGLASGRAEVSVSHAGGGFLGAATARDTLWGWTLGGGIEYLSGPWMFRLEYLHYDLGDIDLAYAVAPAATVATSTNFSGDIVRAGISYKFNWTPLGILLGRDRF